MAMSVTGTSVGRSTFTVAEDPLFGSRKELADMRSGAVYTHGAGPYQVNAVASFVATIPAGTTLTFDLMDIGQLVFQFGGRVSFSSVKELHVRSQEVTSGRVALWGTAGPNDASGYSSRIDPGGSLHVSSPIDGYAVTEASRYLHVANPGALPVALDVFIAGIGTYADT
jgi:hypothetical protein